MKTVAKVESIAFKVMVYGLPVLGFWSYMASLGEKIYNWTGGVGII